MHHEEIGLTGCARFAGCWEEWVLDLPSVPALRLACSPLQRFPLIHEPTCRLLQPVNKACLQHYLVLALSLQWDQCSSVPLLHIYMHGTCAVQGVQVKNCRPRCTSEELQSKMYRAAFLNLSTLVEPILYVPVCEYFASSYYTLADDCCWRTLYMSYLVFSVKWWFIHACLHCPCSVHNHILTCSLGLTAHLTLCQHGGLGETWGGQKECHLLLVFWKLGSIFIRICSGITLFDNRSSDE